MKQIRLGCPIWSCSNWKGTIYPSHAPQKEFLKHYSNKFNTVEGNSTFYAIPTPETFERWAKSTNPGFKFALKFPRTISHDHRLIGAHLETKAFLNGLEILASHGRLGPTFLQLGPDFSPHQLPALKNYLQQLPPEYPYAVEVRHLGWFEEPAQTELNALLENLKTDRVIFDSRPLYSQPPTDESETRSQSRKPRSPVQVWVTGKHPMLRLIGRNNLDTVQNWISQWANQVARWLDQSLEPYVFCHTPDDRFAPEMARRFHEALSGHVQGLEPLPAWEEVQTQKTLF